MTCKDFRTDLDHDLQEFQSKTNHPKNLYLLLKIQNVWKVKRIKKQLDQSG